MAPAYAGAAINATTLVATPLPLGPSGYGVVALSKVLSPLPDVSCPKSHALEKVPDFFRGSLWGFRNSFF